MKRLTIGITLAVLLIAANSPSNAAIIGYSTSFSVGGSTTSVSLPKFDPTLGTLLGAEFVLSGEGTAAFTILNLDHALAADGAMMIGSLTVGLLAPGIGFATPGTPLFLGIPPLPPDGVFPIGGLSFFGGSAGFAPGPEYLGVGTVDIDIDAYSSIDILPPPPLIVFPEVASATGVLRINYTYEAAPPSSVPEPTTLAIWGMFGGLGLIAARRRRKA